MANATHQRCGLHRRRTSLLRIHEDLGALGYGGGYDAVRRYARAWRRRRRLLSPSQAFVPLSFDPGEAYQFDWSHEYARLSGVTTRVKAAHMRLCYSRMQLVQIFPREGQEMVFIVRSARVGAPSCAPRAWARHRALRARGRAMTPRSIRIRRSRARRCGRCSRSRVHARGAHDGAPTRAERTMSGPS